MIGFKLTAHGSGNFKQTREAWTEGSLMLLTAVSQADKILAAIELRAAVKAGIDTAQRVAGVVADQVASPPSTGDIDAVELAFAKLARQRFKSICSQGLDFTLRLTGDIKLRYTFDSSKDSSDTERELLALIGQKAGGKVGDQVMIYMCAIINDFVLMNFDNTDDDLNLTIDVDL